jgi:hypothetical protein
MTFYSENLHMEQNADKIKELIRVGLHELLPV